MARIPTREFNASVPVVVRRFFVANGRHWDVGAEFNWRQLAVERRRVKQLFDAGKLMHPVEGAMVQPVTPTEPIETETETADEGVVHATPAEPQDDLDDLDMKQLREIADSLEVPYRVSREAQRDSIREARLDIATRPDGDEDVG